MTSRGYYGIGIVGSKTPLNVGTLWRSAGILGAAFIFTAGRRYPAQATDTIKSWRHTPHFELDSSDELWKAIPHSCVPVAVELDPRAIPLERFSHPERAIYILGAEDNGIPKRVLDRCPLVVQLPGDVSLNVAVAGSIVLYDRIAKVRLQHVLREAAEPGSGLRRHVHGQRPGRGLRQGVPWQSPERHQLPEVEALG